MVLWIGPSLLDGSSQNRVWVPLTLTLEMQGWGPRCASPRSRSPGSTGGWEGTAGEVMCLWYQVAHPSRRCSQGLSMALSSDSWGELGWRGCDCSHPTHWGPSGLLISAPSPTGMSGPRPVVLSGPSGAGKSTLLKRLLQEHGSIFGFSVSREVLGLGEPCDPHI